MQRLPCAVVLSRSGRYPDHGNSPQPVEQVECAGTKAMPNYTNSNHKSIGDELRPDNGDAIERSPFSGSGSSGKPSRTFPRHSTQSAIEKVVTGEGSEYRSSAYAHFSQAVPDSHMAGVQRKPMSESSIRLSFVSARQVNVTKITKEVGVEILVFNCQLAHPEALLVSLA